jgi:RNA polymerase sigma-70 factor (ECF subfamily)
MFFKSKPETEEDWIEGCRQNKPKSQEMLYKHYYGYAMSICLQYGKNSDEAAEILNDAFFKVFTKISLFENGNSFKGWLRRIVVNTAIDYYRKHNKNLHINIEDIAPPEQDISVDALSQLSAENILSMLQQLPENQRMVFNLFEIEGYSHEEIAEKLGTSSSVSRSHLCRAKQKLRQLLEKQYSISPLNS